MGKFIVIDGIDGSGKSTQTDLLCKYLSEKNIKVRKIDFPVYDNKSSTLVKMYLGGELGQNPSDTNAYAASSFFAMDRYVSYRTDWIKDIMDENTVVVSNRYTTANAVHQLSKLPKQQWESFLSWLWDFEFDKLGLPRPDAVVYLEVHPDVSLKLVHERSKVTGQAIDIHEADKNYMWHSYEAALYSANRLNWNTIACCEGEGLLSVEEIQSKILESLKPTLEGIFC